MNDVSLKNQIIHWLKNQPYWFQYAGNQLLEGVEINNALLNVTYTFFKEDNGLKVIEGERTPVTYNEIEIASAANESNVKLLSINNIENVNALVPEQSILIDKNLTIVYGNNGTGKSGYIRLLNNAFNSRGDKNILSNVFTNIVHGEPKCNFIFRSSGEPFEKKYPTDKNCFEFSQYAVFDAQSVKVHIDNDNQLNFTPNGFDFFEKILRLFDELKALLNLEITQAKLPNNFLMHFQNENVIKNYIISLGAQSNKVELNKLADFNESDEAQLNEIKIKIAALKALNIQEQISGLEKLQRELSSFIQGQQFVLNILTQEKIDYYLGLIDSFYSLQAISNAEGVKSLEQYSIELIGSQQWRDFILAAKNYATAIEQNRNGIQYPSDSDQCVFCLQPLNR
ncbi:MAG: AAA family ATPase, partial [Lutibacter sp.]